MNFALKSNEEQKTHKSDCQIFHQDHVWATIKVLFVQEKYHEYIIHTNSGVLTTPKAVTVFYGNRKRLNLTRQT